MDAQKQNAAGGSGAKSESHANAKTTGGNYIPPVGKKFNADAFLREVAGDVALLYIAANGVAGGRTSNDAPTAILRAAFSIAAVLEATKPRYAHGQIIRDGTGILCGYTTGTYQPGTCRAATCLSFRLMDAENVLGDCKLAERRGSAPL